MHRLRCSAPPSQVRKPACHASAHQKGTQRHSAWQAETHSLSVCVLLRFRADHSALMHNGSEHRCQHCHALQCTFLAHTRARCCAHAHLVAHEAAPSSQDVAARMRLRRLCCRSPSKDFVTHIALHPAARSRTGRCSSRVWLHIIAGLSWAVSEVQRATMQRRITVVSKHKTAYNSL